MAFQFTWRAGLTRSRRLRDHSPLLNRESILQGLIAAGAGLAIGAGAFVVPALSTRAAALVLLLMIGPAFLMIVKNLRRVLLAAIMLDIPAQLATHLGYREDISSLGTFTGIEISLTTIALAILYALWTAELLTRAGPRPLPALRGSLPLLAYVAITALSTVAATNPVLSFFQLFLLAEMVLLYIYIVGTVRTRDEILFLVTMLLLGMIAESVLMIATRVAGHDLELGVLSSHIDIDSGASGDFLRVGGTFGSSNTAAGYLSLQLAPALSLLLTNVDRWLKRLALLAFGLGTLALLLTFSRGGWIACGLSLAIAGFFAWRAGRLRLQLPLSLVAVLVLALLIFPNDVTARVFGEDNNSAASRVPLANLALRIIAAHPVLGAGANNFATVMKDYLTPDFSRAWLYTVHNRYLLIWAETGPAGLLAFLGLFAAILRRGWRAWQAGDALLSPLALASLAAVAGHMTHLFVDVFNGRMSIELVCVNFALITAMLGIMGQPLTRPARSTRRAQAGAAPSLLGAVGKG